MAKKRNEFFEELYASMKQMDEIVRGERKPSRVFEVKPHGAKVLRKRVKRLRK